MLLSATRPASDKPKAFAEALERVALLPVIVSLIDAVLMAITRARDLPITTPSIPSAWGGSEWKLRRGEVLGLNWRQKKEKPPNQLVLGGF